MRSASLVEYLARGYSVHAIVFQEPGAADPARAIPSGRIGRLDVLELPYHSKAAAARVLRNAGRLIRARPPLIDRFSGFERALAGLLEGNSYDAAVIEHFWCAPYLQQIRPHAARVILDLHNIESAWYESLAARLDPAQALAMRRFAAAARELERRWLPGFDSILVTSREEERRVRELAREPRIVVYPNALREVPAPQRLEREEIVFSGNLEYPPNIMAVRFLRDRIWPALRARPDLRWRIVGKNPEGIRHLVAGDPRIELTGFVDDAIAELAAAQVAVIPVLSGSGTRVKILEAWAAATPVVSTSLGAEGLEARDGEHLLLADTAERFAAAVSGLLDSHVERRRIGNAGRKLYEQRFTWTPAWENLKAVF